MNVVVFGASGPTGLELCRQALATGHHVTATVRHPEAFPLRDDAMTVMRADVTDGSSLAPVIGRSDAVLSLLGAGSYTLRQINVYSVGTKAVVVAMRASDHCRRLVVVSSGLTEPGPKVRGVLLDRIVFPILRNVIGRTLYSDMARMENFLESCDDIAWTIMRPGRLIDGDGVSKYRLAENFPVGNVTSRPDLAAAMLAELGPEGHVHEKVAPTTR